MTSNDQNTPGSQHAAWLIALDVCQTGRPVASTGMVNLRRASAELSDDTLARHLVDVALLARDERDFGLAEHLVDVAYHLTSGL